MRGRIQTQVTRTRAVAVLDIPEEEKTEDLLGKLTTQTVAAAPMPPIVELPTAFDEWFDRPVGEPTLPTIEEVLSPEATVEASIEPPDRAPIRTNWGARFIVLAGIVGLAIGRMMAVYGQ